MELNDQVAVGSLIAGGVLLVVAALAYLARETRGQPMRQRIAAMASVARHSACGRIATVVAAGIGGFLASGLICASICYGLLRWYACSLPDYKEAYEGFGDAIIVYFLAWFGLLLSLSVGAVFGSMVALRVHDRFSRRRAGVRREGGGMTSENNFDD